MKRSSSSRNSAARGSTTQSSGRSPRSSTTRGGRSRCTRRSWPAWISARLGVTDLSSLRSPAATSSSSRRSTRRSLAARGDRSVGAGGPLGGASPREGVARAAGAPSPLRRRLLPSLARTGPLVHPGGSVAALASAHERALARLAGLPAVFVHGEFYASNILVSPGRVCPVDWEMAGIGPGVLDLAALATAWRALTALASWRRTGTSVVLRWTRRTSTRRDSSSPCSGSGGQRAGSRRASTQPIGSPRRPPRHDDSQHEGARRQRRRLRPQRGRQPGSRRSA